MAQLVLTMPTRQERESAVKTFVARLGLPRRQLLVLQLLAGRGEPLTVGKQSGSRIAISKEAAGRAMGCGGATFLRGARELAALGVLDIVRSPAPWTYRVNWSAIDRLAPPPPPPGLEESAIFRQLPPAAGQPRADAGQPRASAHTHTYKKQETHSSIPITKPCAPLRLTIDAGELAAAVSGGSIAPLAISFRQIVAQGYLADDREDKTKFLALCHHAATRPGIHNPGGVIYSAVTAYEFHRPGQTSWDWAGELLRERDRARRPTAAAESR